MSSKSAKSAGTEEGDCWSCCQSLACKVEVREYVGLGMLEQLKAAGALDGERSSTTLTDAATLPSGGKIVEAVRGSIWVS